MIDITRFNVECYKIPVDLFIQILNSLPHYGDIYGSDSHINTINQFLIFERFQISNKLISLLIGFLV